MIQLRRLNRDDLYVNPDQIRFVEARGDTVVTFVDGEKLVVLDTPDEILKKILAFRKTCNGAA